MCEDVVEFNCSRDVVVGLEEFGASRAKRLGIKYGRETRHVIQGAVEMDGDLDAVALMQRLKYG